MSRSYPLTRVTGWLAANLRKTIQGRSFILYSSRMTAVNIFNLGADIGAMGVLLAIDPAQQRHFVNGDIRRPFTAGQQF